MFNVSLGKPRFGAVHQLGTDADFRKLNVDEQKQRAKTAVAAALIQSGQQKPRVYTDYMFNWGGDLYALVDARTPAGQKRPKAPREKFAELVTAMTDRLDKTLKGIPADQDQKDRVKENILETLDDCADDPSDIGLRLNVDERMNLDLKYLDITDGQEARIREDVMDTLNAYFVSIAKPLLQLKGKP